MILHAVFTMFVNFKKMVATLYIETTQEGRIGRSNTRCGKDYRSPGEVHPPLGRRGCIVNLHDITHFRYYRWY